METTDHSPLVVIREKEEELAERLAAARDAFVAAFAVARVEGRDLDPALREASPAGALTTRAELDWFLRNNG
jgi:fructose-1-phosphate kinase PfkB-like protein